MGQSLRIPIARPASTLSGFTRRGNGRAAAPAVLPQTCLTTHPDAALGGVRLRAPSMLDRPTLPPFSASFFMTCSCNQMFIGAESLASPEKWSSCASCLRADRLLSRPTERKVRIEVGYGLEGTLTDAVTQLIIQSAILTALAISAGNIERGVDDVVQVLLGSSPFFWLGTSCLCARQKRRRILARRRSGWFPPIIVGPFWGRGW